MKSFDALCILVVVLIGLAVTFDLLGAGFAALRKKPYKSIIGSFVQDLSDRHAVWWLAIVIAFLFAYGLIVLDK